MSFSGFSEDDIRKLAKVNDINKTQKGSNKASLKKVTFKPSNNSHIQKPKTIIINNNSTKKNIPVQELPENAKLSIPSKPDTSETETKPPQSNPEEKSNEINKVEQTHATEPIKAEKKFKDLDEFEARQKLIEEQNRKRKELLAKALADRTKQTQEEAQRLTEIQEEFKKLDAVLSSDVKILRKQIELASFEYMECHKRYQKVEKEFLDAKIVLHQKQEKKELLTEHLCAIIEKNEERKAEKLNELLERLQLSPPVNGVTDVNSDLSKENAAVK